MLWGMAPCQVVRLIQTNFLSVANYNEMLFHQLYDLYDLHHWQDPLSALV